MKSKFPHDLAEYQLLTRYFVGELPTTKPSRLRGKEAREMAKWLEYELARDICDWWRIYKDYQEREQKERDQQRAKNRAAMLEGKKAKEQRFQRYEEKIAEKRAKATPEGKARAYELWLKAHK